MFNARHLLFAAVAVFTSASPSARRSAPESAVVVTAPMANCDKCEDYGVTHYFNGVGAMMDCVAFNSCHGDFQQGYCFEWHRTCGGSETEASTDALLKAARSENPEEVETYLQEHRGYVFYNADRAVLQRIDCGGSITAQYPVHAAVAAALQ